MLLLLIPVLLASLAALCRRLEFADLHGTSIYT